MATSLNIDFKPTPANLKKFFSKEFSSAIADCVAVFNKGSTYYVLVKYKEHDLHYCFVVLTKTWKKGTHLYYKVVESSSIPYHYDLPEKWIPLLDKKEETFIAAGLTDAYSGTKEWLQTCKKYREFIAKFENLKIGTSFEFKNPFNYNGFSESKFFYKGEVCIKNRKYATFKPACKDLLVRLPSIQDMFLYFENGNLTIS